MKNKRGQWIAPLSLVCLVVILLGINFFPEGGRGRQAIAIYNRIQPAMPREAVQALFRGAPMALTTVEHTDLYHVSGRYLIAVTYGPPPDGGKCFDQDWTVREKLFLDVRGRSTGEEVLIRVGFLPKRHMDRQRDLEAVLPAKRAAGP